MALWRSEVMKKRAAQMKCIVLAGCCSEWDAELTKPEPHGGGERIGGWMGGVSMAGLVNVMWVGWWVGGEWCTLGQKSRYGRSRHKKSARSTQQQ